MASFSVCIIWRAGQIGSLPHTHLSHSFIPATDHLTHSNLELERLSTIPGGVKLFAISQCPCNKIIICLITRFLVGVEVEPCTCMCNLSGVLKTDHNSGGPHWDPLTHWTLTNVLRRLKKFSAISTTRVKVLAQSLFENTDPVPKAVAVALEIPITASAEDIRLKIGGKL